MVMQLYNFQTSATLVDIVLNDRSSPPKWTRCANLPVPMYAGSTAVDDHKIYITAGGTPNDDAYQHVWCYDATTNQWSQLPPSGHSLGVLCMIGSRLTIFGGYDSETNNITNKTK